MGALALGALDCVYLRLLAQLQSTLLHCLLGQPVLACVKPPTFRATVLPERS